jgi:hypothetical protein
MVELNDTLDYVKLFLLAAVLGGLGGLAHDLAQTWRGQSGMWEKPREVRDGKYRDWGTWATVFLGAIAAVAALWVFPPQIETTVDAAGKSTTTTEWDIVKTVGLSLIVGFSGGAFLSAMQARALALVKNEEAKQTSKVAQAHLDGLKAAAAAGATGAVLTSQVDGAKADLQSLSGGTS